MLKQRIEQDLKKALLAGDKFSVTVLRGLKSVILYAEVEKGVRDSGLDDDAITTLITKEAKKRQESAELYAKGGSQERADAELREKSIIEGYFPRQLSDEKLSAIVDEVIANIGAKGPQAMGLAISQVKQKVAGQADGARIAVLVRQRL